MRQLVSDVNDRSNGSEITASLPINKQLLSKDTKLEYVPTEKKNRILFYYTYKVLKQVPPQIGISSKSMSIMNSFATDLFARITNDAIKLSHFNKNKTLNDKEKNIALERVKILESGVPSFSSYTQQPKHRFAKRLETEYKNASVFSLLENTIGMNRFWIQTGSKPDALKKVVLENSVSNARKNKQLDDLIEFCAEQTKNIIKIIDPHFLIILGTPARECLGNWHAPKSISVNFAKHPDRSSELSKVLLDIKPALDILS